jgi:hypothetical protein
VSSVGGFMNIVNETSYYMKAYRFLSRCVTIFYSRNTTCSGIRVLNITFLKGPCLRWSREKFVFVQIA